MKKIKYLYFISLLITMSLNTAFADCFTGFACSVADLEKKEQEEINNNINIYKRYFEQKNEQQQILISGKPIKDYNDLFLFNSVY